MAVGPALGGVGESIKRKEDAKFLQGRGQYIDDLVLRDRDTNNDGTLDERLYALQDANWNVIALADTAGTVTAQFLGSLAQAGDFAFLLCFGAFHQGQGVSSELEIAGVVALILLKLVGELVEAQDFVDAAVKQVEVVRDDDECALVAIQEVH